MDFKEKFEKISQKNRSLLCVGLDPEIEKIPDKFKKNKKPIFDFTKSTIDQTCDFICAFKLNIAFYEAYGLDGLSQLKEIIDYARKNHNDFPIILDAKRADIANTAKMYARAVFEYWQADAVTVHPHLGLDSLEPFFSYKDKITFLLLKTSNPDSNMFQDLISDNKPYWLNIAEEVKKWKIKNLGIFVGATYPEDLKKTRKMFPDKIILSAGLGAQGANIQKAVEAGIDKDNRGIIFASSRSIIYANNPRKAAQELRDEINKWR